ncbi:chemotaxis protein CheB [Pedobacter alpinus]|uniref:protein-glutamate methylesterase n=1 Tax=Pedobacter alpinus TaxID=1590643 RepID=A0ABW5TWI1_9SPHI
MAESKIIKPIELLAIGGSAGSFKILLDIIPKLKTPINFIILIVIHRKSGVSSNISDVFKNKTKIKVLECEDKEPMVVGNIYFAPADYHLLIEKDGLFSLDYSEKVNYSRPSIDVTFVNAADLYGNKLAALLLSGANSDGAEGLFYIHQKNGTTIVQSPDSSEIDTMPKEALKLFEPDYIANVAEIITIINNFNLEKNSTHF